MAYAAEILTGGIVGRAIVIPDGVDAAAHCAAMGLPGSWVAAGTARLDGPSGYVYAEGGFYRPWYQIAGADLGLPGEESGFPVGAQLYHLGAVRVSRTPFNVNEPLDGVATTWSRLDGQYVVPAGWEYQIGEKVQEAGAWYRVTQATSFAPSANTNQYLAITGPGREPLAPAVGAWAEGLAYAVGDLRTYQGVTYRCIAAHTAFVGAGWTPPAVPSLWEIAP